MGATLSFIRDGRPEGSVDLEVSRKYCLGRDRAVDIPIKSHGASRRHCEIDGTPTGFFVADLGSSNGTLVNGVAIPGRTMLKTGDFIQIGDILIQFQQTEDEEEEVGATIMMRPGGQVVKPPVQPVGPAPSPVGGAVPVVPVGPANPYAPSAQPMAPQVPVQPAAPVVQPTAPPAAPAIPVVAPGSSPALPALGGPMPGVGPRRRASRDLELGQVIKGFKIVREVDANERGAVYKAKRLANNEAYAIKTMSLTRGDPVQIKRFVRGARKGAELAHPNIIRVYGMGATETFAFTIMEWVEGESAKERMDAVGFRGMMDPRETNEIGIQIAQALELAGDRGIVHRDIKPETILIRKDGVAKLAGLGLAKSFQDTFEDEGLSVAGQIVGTINFAAPETLVDPNSVDHRADIYSLGAAMWGMLSGQPPFQDISYAKTFQRIQEEPVTPVRQINMSIPDQMSDIVGRAMAKHPGQRYQTMAELIRDLMLARGVFPKR